MMKRFEYGSTVKAGEKLGEASVEIPVIVKVNKFDEASVTTFVTEMSSAETTNQPVIPIVIDSYGGQAYALLAMIDVMKSCKKPIATIVEGKAMSCGAILFSMGADNMRFMGSNATLMIHDVSTFAVGKVEEVKADAAEAERLNKLVYKLMASNCGQSENYFMDLIHEKGHADWYVTPDEAIKHKLATAIRIPEFNVKITSETTFK